MFSDDTTVTPKESSWFGSEIPPHDEDETQTHLSITPPRIIRLHDHPLYKEDWIGLKKLDERGGLVFDLCRGTHMHIGECWERLVRSFCGGRIEP